MSSELKKQSRAGVLSLLSGQMARLTAQVISLVVMARFLSPQDYGLTAVVIAIVSVGEVVRDFGLSSSAIQADSLSESEKSNLFWMNTLIGALLATGLFLLAGPLAVFYHDARIESIAQIMSAIFLINGLATQYKAGLSRQMQFKALAVSESAAALASTAIGVACAMHGLGYWAIVAQQVLLNAFILLFYICAHRWLPALPDFKTDMRRFISFGLHLMGSQIIGQLSRSVDTLIIGNKFSAELLGFYNRAQQVVFMALNQINAPSSTLAIPVLSKLKHDSVEYYRFLNFGQSVLLHAVGLFFSLLAINADMVIAIVLGDQWRATVPLVQILSAGAIFQVANYSSYWIFVSRGLTRQQLTFTLFSRPVMIAMIFLGAFYNIYTVAIGYVAGLWFLWLYCMYFLRKHQIDISMLLKNSLVVCFSYLVMTFLVIFLSSMLSAGWGNVLIRNAVFCLLAGLMFFMSATFRETGQCVLRLNLINRIKLSKRN